MRTKGAALGTAANWYDMPTKRATENIFNLSLAGYPTTLSSK